MDPARDIWRLFCTFFSILDQCYLPDHRLPFDPNSHLRSYSRYGCPPLWFNEPIQPQLCTIYSPISAMGSLTDLETSDPTHLSAAAKVLSITELLENILLHVGDLDSSSWTSLFVVQRVSKRFHSVIHTSPSLRRAMFLESPKPSLQPVPELPALLDNYRMFFAAIQSVLYPFWCHLRPSSGPEALILALNISLFWSEETPGVMVGRAPGTLDGSKAIEQRNDSWRNLIVPYHPEHQMELHCCGFPVIGTFSEGQTLGDLADKAIDAGRGHIGNLTPVMYYG